MKKFSEWLEQKINETSARDFARGVNPLHPDSTHPDAEKIKKERELRHVRHYDNGYETGFAGQHGDTRGLSDAEHYHYALGHEHGTQDKANGDEKYSSHVSGKPLDND